MSVAKTTFHLLPYSFLETEGRLFTPGSLLDILFGFLEMFEFILFYFIDSIYYQCKSEILCTTQSTFNETYLSTIYIYPHS